MGGARSSQALLLDRRSAQFLRFALGCAAQRAAGAAPWQEAGKWVHICMYIYIFQYVCLCIYIYLFMCVYVCIHTYIDRYTHASAYVCVDAYVFRAFWPLGRAFQNSNGSTCLDRFWPPVPIPSPKKKKKEAT